MPAIQSILQQPTNKDNNHPSWWLRGKDSAWEQFRKLPMPTRRDEDWRFADLNRISLNPYLYTSEPDLSLSDTILQLSRTEFQTLSRTVFLNNHLIDFNPLPKEILSQGVIWKPISQAVLENPDLVQKYFMTHTTMLGGDKFTALHKAFCQAGMILYLPQNVTLSEPLAAFHWLAGENNSAFPHTLIIAEENAQATVVDFYNSYDDQPGLACGVNDLFIGDNAQVSYIALQNWNQQTLNFQHQTAELNKDSFLRTLSVQLGGSYSRYENRSSLIKSGARSEMLALTFADQTQEFDQRTLQHHRAPHTWSDLLYKNVLNAHSKTIFKGMILVEPIAPQTDAYQTNNNLLLSSDAEADSMPGLEILNDDVKCSHGATTGQVDDQQLFYMKSRGIHEDTAKRLLTFGFLEEVLQRLHNKDIAKQMLFHIQNKNSTPQLQTVA